MISDSLDNLKKYSDLIPFSGEIGNYLEANDLLLLKGGKHEIVKGSVFVLIQEYFTKPVSEKFWESHKKYIDIQIVLDGKEYMGYSPIDFLKIKDAYNEENDIVFYENDSDEHSSVMTQKNHFCVFFPDDGHKPGLHIKDVSRVKKAVIKVLI